MVNLSQEIAISVIEEIIKIIPYFKIDIQQQVLLKNKIEEKLDNYSIIEKSTAIVKGDILEKAFLYLACKKLDGNSEGTIYNYTLLFRKMDKTITKPISMITTMDLRLFLAKEYSDNQPSSLNSIISKIKSFFLWLQDEGYITQNPSKNLSKVKVPYRRRKALDMEEVELLREACVTLREKAIFELTISSGCRVAEISNIKLTDINWNDRTIQVIGKGNKERTVIFSTRAKMFMQNYIKNRECCSIFLFTADKKPYRQLGTRSIEREINKIKCRTEIERSVYPHLCRHTFANTGANQNMSLQALQKLMGHESPTTTQIYFNLNTDNLINEYKKISL